MTGHGMDEKYAWYHTRTGESIKVRRMYEDDVERFSAAPLIFSCVYGITGACGLLFGRGTLHDAVLAVGFAVFLCGFVAAYATLQGGAFQHAFPWRECLLFPGLAWGFSVLVEAKGVGDLFSKDAAIAIVLIGIPLVSYVIWCVQRAVWEPLSLTALALVIAAVVRSGLLDTRGASVVLLATAVLAYLLSGTFRHDLNEMCRGMNGQ